MTRTRPDDHFIGRIAGVGTTSGTRIVVGMWHSSPLGRFVDVMVETEAGRRILLAPSQEVADYVSATYTFDEVRVQAVRWRKIDGGLRVDAHHELTLSLGVGQISALGMLLRAVPSAIATRPEWLRVIDPVARILVPGSATAGTAGSGRREFYGVTLARHITSLEGAFEGDELGALAPLSPPVRFGFASSPTAPTLVDVTTTIRHG